MIFRDAARLILRRGRGIFRECAVGNGRSGEVLLACGYGVAPVGQLLGNFDPGGLREELEAYSRLPEVMGSPPETVVGR